MSHHIDQDAGRFRDKIERAAKEGLKRYIEQGSIDILKPHGNILRVPIRRLQIPRFLYGPQDTGGVGQGDGDVGDPFDNTQKGHGKEHGDSGSDPQYGEFTKQEAAAILEQALSLPNLQEKYGGNLQTKKESKYTGIRLTGPESLRHFKRTFKHALKRAIASGEYDPKHPLIIPVREDKRYRSAKQKEFPSTDAVIVYLLDSSGSTEHVLGFMKSVFWWADAFIEKSYENVHRHYLRYDATAYEVSGDKLFGSVSGGGTSIVQGFLLAARIFKKYPEERFNAFLIHGTDGDCSGLEISLDDLAAYHRMNNVLPTLASDTHVQGNILTSYLIPRCSAVLTCEAQASMGMYMFGKRNIAGYYSAALEDLVKQRTALNKKLKWTSYETNALQREPGKKIMKTLLKWFGPE